MSRILMVTWDGAGNQVATLGIAQELSRAGHDVRLLGQRSIDERCGSDGWTFRPYTHTPEPTEIGPVAPEDEFAIMSEQLWFNGRVASDLADELARETADLLIVDCMLFGGLSQAEAMGIPTVALFHTPFSGFRGGPMVEMLAPSIPGLNELRAELGLRSIEQLSELHDACALSLVATAREFDLEMPLPDNVRYIGPVQGGPPVAPVTDTVDVEDGQQPLVVVSLSTSPQGQLPLLELLVAAIGDLPVRAVVTTGPAIDPAVLTPAANTTVVQFARHDELLAKASLVVTHAGLGTVMASLTHGLPMLCLPMGRDQFFNAMRVEALGAGRMLPPDAAPGAIATSITDLLADDATHAGAKRMAGVIAGYGGSADAMREVEAVVAR